MRNRRPLKYCLVRADGGALICLLPVGHFGHHRFWSFWTSRIISYRMENLRTLISNEDAEWIYNKAPEGGRDIGSFRCESAIDCFNGEWMSCHLDWRHAGRHAAVLTHCILEWDRIDE